MESNNNLTRYEIDRARKNIITLDGYYSAAIIEDLSTETQAWSAEFDSLIG